MAKKKRLSATPTTTRKSERTRKQTQKYETFVKTMEQLGGSSTAEDILLAKPVLNQGNFEPDDRDTMSMLNGVYDLVTDFNLDVNGSNIGCYNTLIRETEVEQHMADQIDLTVHKVEMKCEVETLKEEKHEMEQYIEKLNGDLHKLEDAMYKKDELSRKQGERIRQLENTNYRQTVVTLEAQLEEEEIARRQLENMLETKDNKLKEMQVKIENQKKETTDLELKLKETKTLLEESEENKHRHTENLSYFMNENQKLKNLLKVEKKDPMKRRDEDDENIEMLEEQDKVIVTELRDDFEKFKRFICQRVDKLTDMYYRDDSTSSSTSSFISSPRQTKHPSAVSVQTPDVEQRTHPPPPISVNTPCLEQHTITPSPEVAPCGTQRSTPTEPSTYLIPGTTSNQTNVNTVLTASSSSIHPSGTAYIPSKNDVTLNNPFNNLQFINNNNQQTGTLPIVRPGTKLYSGVVGGTAKAAVFSTSMTRDFNMVEFRRSCKPEVNLHKFNGKKAKYFKTYVTAHLPEDNPDIVVIQCGGNDLPTKASVPEIANQIIDAGIVCREMGVKRVMISSVLPRADFHLQLKRHELNKLLEAMCEMNNFIFIRNQGMTLSRHIDYDGVHLNEEGTKVLQRSFINCLNGNV